jgi:uncharacterized membrane protein YfcA
MAQYKAAMLRIFGEGAAVSTTDISPTTMTPSGGEAGDNSSYNEDVCDGQNVQPNVLTSQMHLQPPSTIKYIRESWATSLLDVVLPLVWLLFFVSLMTREAFFSLIHLPFLGVFAAVLANCVPIGGGIVYIPALALLGNHVHLTVSFTLSTMSIGNGILGHLRWLLKDPSLIIYESFEWTVVPSSVGSLIALFFMPKPHVFYVKRGFSVFCILLGGYVLVALRRRMALGITGGAHGHSGKAGSAHGAGGGGGNTSTNVINRPRMTKRGWGLIAVVSFFMGLLVVPNIGIGPALMTFLLLEFFGYSEQEAMVTGIVTGGLVCWVPAAVHYVVLNDVDLQQWVMVLPGVYYGAKLAPLCHEYFGLNNIMWAFATFLFATATLFLYL